MVDMMCVLPGKRKNCREMTVPSNPTIILIILHLLIITSSTSAAAGPAVRLIKLTPLRCRGSFNVGLESPDPVPAVFLSQGKLEVLEDDDEADDVSSSQEAILCDIMPVPLYMRKGELLVNPLLQSPSISSLKDPYSISSSFINRDGGIYDNLPYVWRRGGRGAKLELYTMLQQIRVNPTLRESPQFAFFKAIDTVLDAKITGLFFEVRDELATNRVSLGAALVFARNAVVEEWRLTRATPNLPSVSSTDDTIGTVDACVVNCHPDELIAISILLKKPIYMPEPLFEASAVDARLVKGTDDDDEALTIYAPVFSSPQKRAAWEKSLRDFRQAGQGTPPTDNPDTPDSTQPKRPKAAWDIFDPTAIFKMSTLEKRETLRASGLTELPRPRDGLDPLDRALVERMDEAVRGEVLRLMSLREERSSEGEGEGEGVGAYNAAAESARQLKLREMGQALDAGDEELAERLREEFARMTARRADPTQREGSYNPYLDQDDWYQEQRRKAMASKKPATKEEEEKGGEKGTKS